MTTAVSAWTCPQCGRRVPGRAPLCHCGFTRGAAQSLSDSRSAAGVGIAPSRATSGTALVLAAAAGMCVVAALVFAAARPGVRRNPGPASAAAPRMRGPVGYPALPPVAKVRIRHGRQGAAPGPALPPGMTPLAAPSLRPPTPVEQDWSKAVALLDLPLRRIAADTSVLALSYRPFAEACVEAPGGEWLASLKRVALRPGVTLRENNATVDCATARAHLVVRSDALKAALAATQKMAEASHVPPEHWRTLLATHDLTDWELY
jgi:hypothetical protein